MEQPYIILVDENLRLIAYTGAYEFAYPWYQDEELVKMVDNKPGVYSMENLKQMYHYLANAGELYFIEIMEKGQWIPVGDVTLCSNGDLPIVIAPNYQSRGIGQRVLRCLIERARTLEFKMLEVGIYPFNQKSQALFKKVGFVEGETTDKDIRFRLLLS